MLVSILMCKNMAAGNEQKHWSLTEFSHKSVYLSLEELQNELFR